MEKNKGKANSAVKMGPVAELPSKTTSVPNRKLTLRSPTSRSLNHTLSIDEDHIERTNKELRKKVSLRNANPIMYELEIAQKKLKFAEDPKSNDKVADEEAQLDEGELGGKMTERNKLYDTVPEGTERALIVEDKKKIELSGIKNELEETVNKSPADSEVKKKRRIAIFKRRRSKKDKTKKADEGYFERDMGDNPMRIKEYDIVFNPKRFFEFFFYHFVFFFMLGPLSFLILFPIAGKKLTMNMGFFGWNTMMINQTVQFGLLFTAVFLWFYFPNGPIQWVEVYMIVISVLLRISTISSKYGSTHPLRIKLLKSKILTYQELTEDYMLIKWRDQTDEIIEQEYYAALKRHDVDLPLFFFKFLGELDKETAERLLAKRGKSLDNSSDSINEQMANPMSPSSPTELVKGFQDFFSLTNGTQLRQQNSFKEAPRVLDSRQLSLAMENSARSGPNNETPEGSKTPLDATFAGKKGTASPSKFKTALMNSMPQSMEKMISFQRENSEDEDKKTLNLFQASFRMNAQESQTLSALNLGLEILHESRKRSLPKILQISLGFGLVRGLVPMFYRIADGQNAVGDTFVQGYIAIVLILTNMYFWGANLAFIIIGFSDLRKKLYLMTQLSHLISAKRVEQFNSKKVYPTMNIYDPFSVKTWTNMRKVFLDFGRKYFLRINLNISLFLFCYLLLGMLIALHIFGVVITNALLNPLLLIIFLFEFVVMISWMVQSIAVGASINSHFSIHKLIMQKNKSVISDLLKLDDIYFPANDLIAYKPGNFMYKKGVEQINRLIELANLEKGSEEAHEAIQIYLEKLVDIIEDAISSIEADADNIPVKFLGLQTSFGLIGQMVVGIGSISFAVIQRVVQVGSFSGLMKN